MTLQSGANWFGPLTWSASESSAKRHQAIDSTSIAGTDHDSRHRDRLELGEILEAARRAVLSPRQDRIVELWMRGWAVPEIGAELTMPVNRVSDEKYKALRKLEHHLRSRCEELGIGPVAVSALARAQRETAGAFRKPSVAEERKRAGQPPRNLALLDLVD